MSHLQNVNLILNNLFLLIPDCVLRGLERNRYELNRYRLNVIIGLSSLYILLYFPLFCPVLSIFVFWNVGDSRKV